MAKVTDRRGTEIRKGNTIMHIIPTPDIYPGQVVVIGKVYRIRYNKYVSIGIGHNRHAKDCLVLPTVEIDGKVWCTDASLMPNDLVCLVNMVMTDKHIHTDMGFKKGKRFYGKNSGCDIKYIDTWWPADPQMPEIGQ